MTILLLVLVVLSWVLAVRATGVFSLWSALLLGFSVYSVPALVGHYLRPTPAGLVLVDVSVEALRVLVWAWFWILVSLLAVLGPKSFSGNPVSSLQHRYIPPMSDSRGRVFCIICLLASIALYAWISVIDSPLFFLGERQVVDVVGERQKLLWKWVNLYGLVSALLIGSRRAAIAFSGFIGIFFLAGDRTMILISGVTLAVYFFQYERNIRRLLRVDLLLLVLLVALLILLGKPIYHAVKLQNTIPLEMLFSPGYRPVLLSFFEPLLTHTILEDVISRNFSYSWGEFSKGLLGQLLIIPSEFGIDSSAFNVQLQRALYPWIGFGIANHFVAQAWSLGGWLGVSLFSCTLVAMVGLFSRFARSSSPLPRIMLVIMGVVVGTYFFRNSLENILSMLRQIFLVGAALLLATQLVSRVVKREARAPLRLAFRE